MRHIVVDKVSARYLSNVRHDLFTIPLKPQTRLYLVADTNLVYLGNIVGCLDEPDGSAVFLIGDDYSKTLIVRREYSDLQFIVQSDDTFTLRASYRVEDLDTEGFGGIWEFQCRMKLIEKPIKL